MATFLNLRIKLEKQSWVYKTEVREKILKIISEKGIFTEDDRKSIAAWDIYTSTLDFIYADGRTDLNAISVEGIFGGQSDHSEKDALIRGLENLLKHLKGYK